MTTVEIEDFYQTTDGDDWSPAIERAQDAFHATNDPADPRGFTLAFRPRTYNVTTTIHLIRGMRFLGSGGFGFGGTRLVFPDGVPGLVCERPATASPKTPGRGDFSIVEGIQFIARGKSSSEAHGIYMHAPLALRDVYIEGFGGNGIHIQAGASEREGTNADGWQIYNCRVGLCGGDGLFLKGTDANAGCAMGLQCSDNGGWAIQDISRVGNTYIACQSHENGRNFPLLPRRAYRCMPELAPNGTELTASQAVFINCYSEGVSQIAGPAMVIGGYMDLTPNRPVHMSYYQGTAGFPFGVTGFGTAADSVEPGKKIFATCSVGGEGPAALTLTPFNEQAAESSAYQLMYQPVVGHKGWWSWHWAGQSGSPLMFSTNRADEREGQLWLQMGYYFGRLATGVVKLDAGVEPPIVGTWKHGDRILNSRPVAPTVGAPAEPQNYAGWICVAAGTPGTWKGFGLIEAQ